MQWPKVESAPPPAPVVRQFSRFAAVGVVNTLIDFGAYNVLLALGAAPIPANIVSLTLGMTFSFAANRAFVFGGTSGSAIRQATLFVALTVFSLYVLQNAIILLLLRFWRLPLELVVVGARWLDLVPPFSVQTIELNAAKGYGTIVSLTWNFLSYRFIVFPRPAK